MGRAAGALVALASAAGLGLCGTAILSPASLQHGLPVLLLFYPLLWALAIGAVLRARRG